MKKISIIIIAFVGIIIGFVSCPSQDLDISFCKITFYTNGGNEIPDLFVKRNNKAIQPVNPTKESTETLRFSFDNWYTSSDGGRTLSTSPFNFDTLIKTDITLYANWIETALYSITINNVINGTISVDKNNGIAAGEAITIIITPDSGYQLTSLSVMKETVSINVTNNSFIMPEGNVTVTAMFSEIHPSVCTVSFDTTGGIAISNQNVEFGETISRPANNPTKEATARSRYSFDNWYTSPDGGETLSTSPFNFDTPITTNMTLYAKWIETSLYSITVNNVTNGSFSISKTDGIVSGESISFFVTPDEGYRLNTLTVMNGLSSVSVSSDSFIMPEGDVTITIVFSVVPYVVLPAGTDGSAGPTGTYVMFGKWPQTNTSFPSEESIKWRVLTTNYDHDNDPSTPGKKLLLAENILLGIKYYDYQTVDRRIDNKTIYPNNYEYSRVRAYLNGLSYQKKSSDNSTQILDESFVNNGFLQIAFTTEEQEAIVTTTVINDERSTNPYEDATYMKDNMCASDIPTLDKIFLLSFQEVTNTEYGFMQYGASNNERLRNTTHYSYTKNGVSNNVDGAVGPGMWYLRSADKDSRYAVGVDGLGRACIRPHVNTIYGVVPALCID